jgi:hypothetical protein
VWSAAGLTFIHSGMGGYWIPYWTPSAMAAALPRAVVAREVVADGVGLALWQARRPHLGADHNHLATPNRQLLRLFVCVYDQAKNGGQQV